MLLWSNFFVPRDFNAICFSTFHACSTDKWCPHSWMIMVDLSSGPCIAKLFFRDLNSFYLSAWSFCVSLMGILLFLLTTKLRLPEKCGSHNEWQDKRQLFSKCFLQTTKKETIQIKTLRKRMQMGSQISVSTPLPFPLSYCPSAPWSSPPLTLVCPLYRWLFRLLLINV